MSTVTEIETACATYLRAMFPTERVLVQGNIGEGPAPSGPSLIWRLDTLEPPDFTVTEISETEQLIEAHGVPMEFVVTVLGDRVGQSARDDAMRLVLGLRQTQRTADLLAVCGFMGVGEVRNLSALETGTMRQRAEFRLMLSASLHLAATPETINVVDLELHEPTREFDLTITVEGPI